MNCEQNANSLLKFTQRKIHNVLSNQIQLLGKRGDKCCLNLMIGLLKFENYFKWFTMDNVTEHA